MKGIESGSNKWSSHSPFPKLSFVQESPFQALNHFEIMKSSARTVLSVGGVDKSNVRVSCFLAPFFISVSFLSRGI